MAKIFLSTHGRMASGMRSSVEILTGSSEAMEIYDAYVDDAEMSLQEAVENFLRTAEEEETKLLISDMYGGSVNQVLVQYASVKNVYVITGITLSLLLELLVRCNENFTKQELEAMIAEAREMTRLVELEQRQEEEDFF